MPATHAREAPDATFDLACRLPRPHRLCHPFITAVHGASVPLRNLRAAASHADLRTTMRYDHARQSLDQYATYIVAAFVAGASRSASPNLPGGINADPTRRRR